MNKRIFVIAALVLFCASIAAAHCGGCGTEDQEPAKCPATKGCPVAKSKSCSTAKECPLGEKKPCCGTEKCPMDPSKCEKAKAGGCPLTSAKKCKPNCAKPCCGGVALFDGKSFDGWTQRGGKAPYVIKDGVIIGTTLKGTPNSFMCTKKDYADFVLTFDFKVDEGLNSGVQFRSKSYKEYKDGRVHGYQCEIDPKQSAYNGRKGKNLLCDGSEAPLTEPRCWTGGIYGEGGAGGWLYPLVKEPKARKAFKPGEWNHLRIQAIGNKINTWVNCVPAANLVDDQFKKGFIGLQVHSTKSDKQHQVRWKNIYLKEIEAPSACKHKKHDHDHKKKEKKDEHGKKSKNKK